MACQYTNRTGSKNGVHCGGPDFLAPWGLERLWLLDMRAEKLLSALFIWLESI